MGHNLREKKVAIFGGSSGIGLATAEAAVAEGCIVTIASRNETRLKEAASRLNGKVTISVVDILRNEAIESFFQGAGVFDHIIVSAASTKTGPIRQLAIDDAYASMDSKFWGAYRIAKAARINPSGSLTLVSGFLSKRPNAMSGLQGAINAAVEGLVRGLALEFAPIRVNAVSPGLIDTPILTKLGPERRQAMLDNAKQYLPVQRVGAPEDIAHAILFVASNPYATGSVVTVDGGATIGSINIFGQVSSGPKNPSVASQDQQLRSSVENI
jgi:NAD(P)-dependent dehydrogenase (short-subunit alcohol dehydrogenase family)